MADRSDAGDASTTRSSDRAPTTGELESMASLLGRLAAAPGGPDNDAPILPGTVLEGTYRVERAIGEGGMGVVYLAHDLRLHRDVALKVGRQVSVLSLVRLEREAAALARLSHPNVVVVYQVGAFHRRVFLAMEYVPGGTARAWLDATHRTWREVVALYAAAGDGLAAAHDAGLIHRDFKPDNVLVSEDGRPRVADFGLARSEHDDLPATAHGEGATASMTQTGAVLGTPAYMPPEQLAGEPLDARADQFAFCAALWEALYGLRPFAGKTPVDVAAAIASSRPRTPNGEPPRRVPRHVARALRKGLSPRRADRYPSMAPLLAELRRDPARRWRRIGAVAGIAGAAGGAVLATQLLAAAPIDPCAGGPSEIARAWNPARVDALRGALRRTRDAAATSAVIGAFDRWSQRWAVAYRAACEAGAPWSPELRDRSAACLAQRRAQLTAAVDVITHGDAVTTSLASAATSLDDPDRCADARFLLAAVPPPPPGRAAALAPLRAALERARTLRVLGRSDTAGPLGFAVVAGALAAEDRALVAEGHAIVSDAAYMVDDNATALEQARAAYFEGEASGAGAAVVTAAAVRALTFTDGERDRADDWADLAVAAAARTDDPRLELKATHAMIITMLERGETGPALEQATAAVALGERLDGPQRSMVLTDRARVFGKLGNAPAALADLERARQLVIEAGGESPALDTIDILRARAFFALDRIADVIALQQQLVIRNEAFFGPDSERVAGALLELASTLCTRNPEGSLPILARAETIRRGLGERRSYDLAAIANNRALALSRLGRHDEAIAAYRTVIEILVEVRGADHPLVAQAWSNLGSAAVAGDQPAVAFDALDRAIAMYEKIAPADDDLADALTARGTLATHRGDLAAARRDLERALALRSGPDVTPSKRALTQARLAAVRAAQGDRRAALSLARAARAALPPDTVFSPDLERALDAILAPHH